ncbi:hypothetical protein T484DRAFT_1811185 [Baffinella frigidus]|nr:hypothetical protein T484DRAFT_1811185 [Cryptophyta sp. CCMP2293]
MPPFSRRSKRGARPPRTPAKEVDETGEEAPRCVTPRASIPIDAVTRPLRTLLDSPGTSVLSPFATFASSMPNLTSPLGKRSAGGEPASPFTGFASQLPNLSASPGVSLMACGANIATPGKFPGSWALSIDATFACVSAIAVARELQRAALQGPEVADGQRVVSAPDPQRLFTQRGQQHPQQRHGHP